MEVEERRSQSMAGSLFILFEQYNLIKESYLKKKKKKDKFQAGPI